MSSKIFNHVTKELMQLSVNDMVQNHHPSVSQLQMPQSSIFFEKQKVRDSYLMVICVFIILARLSPHFFSNTSCDH